jgi:outer membrane protein assembly factor BamE
VLAGQQARLFELREHAVDGGEADIDALGKERLVHVLGRKVPHLARFEQLEDLAPGQGRLEAAVLQALHRAHRLSLYAPMHRSLLPVFLLFSLLALTSCGYVPRIPGVTPYRIDIQQGNFISQDMVAQLKPGMSKEQVRLTLGTPLLTDIFHADRWDYVYWMEKSGRKPEQRKLTVYFEDGKLTRLDGDVVAAGATQ